MMSPFKKKKAKVRRQILKDRYIMSSLFFILDGTLLIIVWNLLLDGSMVIRTSASTSTDSRSSCLERS
jgi:hypothetical protein